MQRSLPHVWKKYWDCAAKGFDLSMMLQEIENRKLHIQDRLLLSLLVRIRLGDVNHGKAGEILTRREQIKKMTMLLRSRHKLLS